MKKIRLSEEEWEKKLSSECYKICRKKGTEQPFTNLYCDCHDPGIYHCAACSQPLFRSEDKFDSGSGWPSFTKPINEDVVNLRPDRSHSMERTEVICNCCESHLGHVFNDGPKPEGKRYCINSTSLQLLDS